MELFVLKLQRSSFFQVPKKATEDLINQNEKKNRRKLKKNKRKEHMKRKLVTIVGMIAAGIASKMEPSDKMLFDLQPSIWMLKETKRKLGEPRMKAFFLKP